MARRNFLAYFFLTSCLVSGQSPRYVLKGQKVTLVTKGITGQPDNILWKHNGNKVVEFNGREEHVYDPYKTRVTLDWLSAELDISDLRLEDSGKYELEVSVNKKLEKSYHDVEVLDKVAKPTISCNISNSDNSGTLVCSAEPRQPVHLMMFEWHSQGSVHPGPHLQISLGDEHDDKVYNCTVRNPLTTETAAFTAKDCHTTKSSSVAPIAIAVFISLLLLIVGAGIFYFYKKQKGCFAKRQTDVENQKLYIRNGSGGTVETDEATPFIDGKSSSGKSSVGADKVNRGAAETEHLSKSADKETQQDEPNATAAAGRGLVKKIVSKFEEEVKPVASKQERHAPNKSESPAESAENTSSEQNSSTAPASPDTVEDTSNTDKGDSDPEQSSKVPQGKASDPAAVGPGMRPDSEPESADKKHHQLSDDSSVDEDSNGQQLYESAEEEKQQDAGDPEPNNESTEGHKVALSGRKSSTASDGSGSDKKQHQLSDDSSVDEDSDGQQLYESAEEETQSTGDPEPNNESTEDHKVVLSGRKSSTASDDSGSDKNQHQPSDDSSVHEDSDRKQLEKPTEEEKQQGAGDPEPNNESTEGHKVLLSGRKSSTASDDSVSDQKRPDQQNNEASPSSVTPSDAGSNNNQHQPSDDSSVHEDSDGQQLEKPTDKETQSTGDPEPNNESNEGHKVALSGRKSSTASDGSVSDQKRPDQQNTETSSSVTPPDADKNQHQPSDDSSVHEDSDRKQLEKPTEEEKQQGAGDPEPNDESDNGHKIMLSGRKSSTASDDSVSDQKRPDQQNNEASPSSVTPPDAGSDKNQHQPSDDSSVHEDSDRKQLEKPTEEEKQQGAGDPEPNNESTEGHKIMLSGRKSSTASDGSGSDKNQHQSSDDSSVHEDSDRKQLEKPTEEETQSTHDPEPNDESTEESKDMSSERKCSTASDGSDQKISDHPKAEASSPSVTLPDAGQTKDDVNNTNTPVEERLSEGSDKQEGHASNKSESADVNQDPSSEHISSSGPVSVPDTVDDHKTDKSDSDPEQPSKVALGKATDTAFVGPGTEPHSEPETAGSNNNQYQPSDDVRKDSDGPAEEETQQGAGDPETNDESADRSKDVSSECKSSSSSGGSGLETKL